MLVIRGGNDNGVDRLLLEQPAVVNEGCCARRSNFQSGLQARFVNVAHGRDFRALRPELSCEIGSTAAHANCGAENAVVGANNTRTTQRRGTKKRPSIKSHVAPSPVRWSLAPAANTPNGPKSASRPRPLHAALLSEAMRALRRREVRIPSSISMQTNGACETGRPESAAPCHTSRRE